MSRSCQPSDTDRDCFTRYKEVFREDFSGRIFLFERVGPEIGRCQGYTLLIEWYSNEFPARVSNDCLLMDVRVHSFATACDALAR